MDINFITKQRNRKAINDENKNVLNKLSKLSSDSIKLKVAQDAAYWDVRQKLQQVEGNHERLQQNMVDLQMQYETVSGQYQEELRQRPEALNKLNSTRKICDVLEDYSERLKQTLSRCQTDQTALCAAYQSSGQLVQDLKTSHQQAEEKNQRIIANLEVKVKKCEERETRLLDIISSCQQKFASEMNAAREALGTSQAAKEELQLSLNEQKNELSRAHSQLEKKNEDITTLVKEMTNMKNEFYNEIEGAKKALDSLEKSLKQANEDNNSLKTALNNQEEFCKSIREDKNILQEAVAALEDEKNKAIDEVVHLKNCLEEFRNSNDAYKIEVSGLNEIVEKLKQDVKEKEEVSTSLESDLESLNDKMKGMEEEKIVLAEALEKTEEERKKSLIRIQELIDEIQGIRTDHCNQRQSMDLIINELMDTIACQKQDLERKASTASKLMTDLRNVNDVLNKTQDALNKHKKELEEEKEHCKEIQVEMGVRNEHLHGQLQERDNDISKQINLIQELSKEKERLQIKMIEMQNTINNARHELSAPIKPVSSILAESDNAVMGSRESGTTSPVMTPSAIRPIAQKKPELNVFTLFSDSSNDTLDRTLVNRRFEALARGERLTPIPLSSMKRRREPPKIIPEQRQGQCPPPAPVQELPTNKFFKTRRPNASKPKGK